MGNSKDKSVMKKDTSQVTKQFAYFKGGVELKFSLRIDVKQQLKEFKECLEQALKDVSEELNAKK